MGLPARGDGGTQDFLELRAERFRRNVLFLEQLVHLRDTHLNKRPVKRVGRIKLKRFPERALRANDVRLLERSPRILKIEKRDEPRIDEG